MKKKIIGIFVCMLLLLMMIPIGSSSVDNEPVPELTLKVYGGLGLTIIIKNVGDAEATNVSMFIGIFGGKVGSKNSDIKKVRDLSPGKSAILRFRYVGFGIGLFQDMPIVQVHVGCDEEKYNNTDMNAWILFNLIILR
jgi:hypothetical protein